MELQELICEMYYHVPLFHDLGKINPIFQNKNMGNLIVSTDRFSDFLLLSSKHSLFSSVLYINIFAKKIFAINVGSLNTFEDGAIVDYKALVDAGFIKREYDGIKILSNGNLTKKINVKANAFSTSAKQKIEEAGGKAEVI